MKAHTGVVRVRFSWAREMRTGEESCEETTSLSLTTVTEMMTLFTCHSVGQLSAVEPSYHELRGRGRQGVNYGTSTKHTCLSY